jgi:putative urate catabolism protein
MMGGPDDPRDLIGYGAEPPRVRWPGGARLALNFVLNYEEGAENSILHGDDGAETFLSEIMNAPAVVGARHASMESLYDYGSRAGFWRIRAAFEARGLPLTVFGVAMAMQRNPRAVEAMLTSGWEVASHGYRWINYQNVPEDVERAHMERAIEIHTRLTGARPLGWYTGRSSPHTARLVAQEGGFVYDSDSYADDLPYYDSHWGRAQLILPYALDSNDMRFVAPQGFNTGEDFFQYLKDAVDVLRAEGAAQPKMLSVGLHCRIIGRPGRFASLVKFLDYVTQFHDIWVARRIDIARHWQELFPPPG